MLVNIIIRLNLTLIVEFFECVDGENDELPACVCKMYKT